MSTLDEIQLLSDGEFHRLGDALLRRLETRYRHLRTHGLNVQGESIKGQPDSYVGETASSCSIAVCYTVQRRGWWNKVVNDVREAVAASSLVSEVVAVIPHNADRDGPKDKTIDWLADAKAASSGATFRLIDGREIAHLLDLDHQDLRYSHLNIPYSRLNGTSILASARAATASVIDAIRASGRYDPRRYAPRSAAGVVYQGDHSRRRDSPFSGPIFTQAILPEMVDFSVVGKTSLVCSFAESLRHVLPIVLVQARDLTFSNEDALVAHVVHALQGF